ncbi:hypothetical protein D187_004047 [Cystobacter fuscus DSM 2262]|uniref:Uncharacterized protein n=1 Tax=Cystobacter fuscus (strain ATCC 25194 / DSM 2262 / NBRC 100088 / M29) TaxID=1242864 RepID=S9P517_CYSF2|nr:hypothetical protein [Cystobacter fuscus]EPX58291.1 hypothetical protein D187_004047 [Cystobacter fuscus DSM 2262]
MADLPQGRRPSQRTTRPLLLATAGVALVKMASGCLISGNLVAPPPCDDNPNNEPYCEPGPDAGVDGGLDAGSDGGTGDGGTADGGQ